MEARHHHQPTAQVQLSPPPVLVGHQASYPARPGNVVRPLIDGIPAFARIGAAINEARASVWIGISFIDFTTFVFPGFEASEQDGHFWSLLTRVAKRGVDVRLLCWSNNAFFKNSHFQNSQENFIWLKSILGDDKERIRIRWDQSNDAPHCHHEKSFLIDAGQESEVAFVGGIGMNISSLVTPEHPPLGPESQVDHHNHDIFFELQGPSATDVHHHFVQRWNGALGHYLEGGSWPSLDRANNLPFPSKLSKMAPMARGFVQVQRSLRPLSRGGYDDTTPAVIPEPHAGTFLNIREGEQSIYEQYKLAFAAAQRTIYIENQHVAHPVLLDLLIKALGRGVVVIYLAPARVMRAVAHEREAFDRWLEAKEKGEPATRPRYAEVWEKLNELSAFENFVLAGLGVYNSAQQRYQIEYVHSKLAIVDGAWYTGGSANLVDLSMEKDHTELNISVWDDHGALCLLRDLCEEHTGVDTRDMNDLDIACLLQRTAKSNAQKMRQGEQLSGHIFALDPLTYGRPFS